MSIIAGKNATTLCSIGVKVEPTEPNSIHIPDLTSQACQEKGSNQVLESRKAPRQCPWMCDLRYGSDKSCGELVMISILISKQEGQEITDRLITRMEFFGTG
ncbi:hypothetical protein scyTo_0003596 [Scyliorhinus torazame]|uniref:Uncharacterized protein n=1 Tax=Scyliorhinus torazame TaxID=75743 RepID=A0A401PN17_SCYTO|nr:hypothetical protein [Scyliorhinus torazame]